MFIKTHASLRNFSPSKFVAVIARLSETERELVVEIMHPASFIETMCLKTQLVAAYLYLKASLGFRFVASSFEQVSADTLTTVIRVHNQLHYLTYSSGMMQLAFHPQVDASRQLSVFFAYQAGVAVVFQLFGIDFFKFIVRKLLGFHVAYQCINVWAICLPASTQKPFAYSRIILDNGCPYTFFSQNCFICLAADVLAYFVCQPFPVIAAQRLHQVPYAIQ